MMRIMELMLKNFSVKCDEAEYYKSILVSYQNQFLFGKITKSEIAEITNQLNMTVFKKENNLKFGDLYRMICDNHDISEVVLVILLEHGDIRDIESVSKLFDKYL